MKKKKIVMYVYSDLKTDARVNRSIQALKENYDITIYATDSSVGKISREGYCYVDVIDSRIKNHLVRYIKSLITTFGMIKKTEASVIYGHDYYAAPLLLLAKIKHRNIVKIYDAHELYVPNDKSSKREKIVFLIEKQAIEKSDYVICASEKRKEIMEQLFSTLNPITAINNVSMLPQETNGEEIFQNNPGLIEFLANSKKTIVYCGAIIPARRIDKLVNSAKEIESFAQILIVGGGESKNKIVKMVLDNNICNVFMIGSIPYSDIYSIISKCDIGYLFYENNTLNNQNCAPNKIYEYASAGVPMIANNNPGLQYMFKRYSVGVVNDDITQAINELVDSYDIYKAGLFLFLKECSWEQEEEKLKGTVSEAIGELLTRERNQ